MIRTLACTLSLMALAALSPVYGQDKEAQQSERTSKLMKQFLATLAKEGITLDQKRKTVTVPVVVNAPENELEFLLINPIGKKHEALLLCKSKPSVLKAAFLAIGFKNGKNASFKPKKPAPTEAEMKAGVDPMVLVPPTGMQVWMTVTYDVKGKPKTIALEELLQDWEANHSITDHKWIFLGGRMAKLYRGEPEVFMADYEGNLVTTCYKHPPNHLITLEHERARDDMNWSATRACPPPGTEMKLTFHSTKPVVVAAYEVKMKKLADAAKKAAKDDEHVKRKERKPARRK